MTFNCPQQGSNNDTVEYRSNQFEDLLDYFGSPNRVNQTPFKLIDGKAFFQGHSCFPGVGTGYSSNGIGKCLPFKVL